MKFIKTFEGFKVNEALGLAEVTLIYDEFILNEFRKYLDEFLKSDMDILEKSEVYTESDLSTQIEDPSWISMPISSLRIDFTFKRFDNSKFTKEYPKTSLIKDFNGLGSCYPIVNEIDEEGSYISGPINDKTDKTIHLRLQVGVIINNKFSDVDGVLIETESSITHELNHAYEGWKRISGGAGMLSTDVTWATDANRSKIKKEIWKYWLDRISLYLYWSERHESNAMTQESWPYVKRYDIDEMKLKCPAWRYANDMTKFNSDDFKRKITDIIKQTYPDADPELILNRIKNGFANQLIESRKLSIVGNENAPSLSGEKVKKMNIDKFLKYTEIRINKAGENLKRKILRLYALK